MMARIHQALTLAFFIFGILNTRPLLGQEEKIRIGTYNLSNFFNHKLDQKLEDGTYLPKDHVEKESRCRLVKNLYYRKLCFDTDWTEESFDKKTHALAKVIRLIRPDILGIQEIESDEALKPLLNLLEGYSGEVSVGSDGRGIRVGYLYRKDRLKLMRKWEVPHKNTRPTLFGKFGFGQCELVVGVHHWPSLRHKAIKRKRVLAKIPAYKNETVIWLGDFNFDRDKVLEKIIRKKGLSRIWSEKREFPGTYFYSKNMAWSFLDKIFVSKRSMRRNSKFRYHYDSYRVMSENINSDKFYFENGPFKGSTIAGVPRKEVSDHLPVFADFLCN